MKRYNFCWFANEFQESETGCWVGYHDANNAIQDERDKLARIERIAQVAVDNWPPTALFFALKTVLQICQDGKASPITEGQSSE